MYHDFFGFTQVPFSIAPDPDFLFLGPRHREGLAHLRNGLTGSGGFLLLTGEVGTGKTTLSRAILAELGDSLDVAFVLNPMLSERELLATICDQFKIPGRHEKASLKRLTDHLSRFLQEAGEQGRNPVVLIDEAQHLLPSVLEQLRLLTNLETDSRKLLSVVLIGQPELQDLLQRRELRQVAQRIVARYHLLPLTLSETNQYIQHRLQRVEAANDIFSASALKAVWRFSQGTPRLINLVCDRALQIAARDEQKQVSAKHVAEAQASLSFAPSAQVQKNTSPKALRYFPAAIVLLVTIGAVSWGISQYSSIFSQDKQTQAQATQYASEVGVGMSLLPAIELLADQWNVASFAVGSEPCQQLLDVELACLRGNFSVSELVQLDTPLLFESSQSANYYLLLGYGSSSDIEASNSRPWLIWDGESLQELSQNEFASLYSGKALFLWQIPDSSELPEVIRHGLTDRVPYTLQNRSLERQLQWLRQSQYSRILDELIEAPDTSELTAIELALLSSAYYQERPRLADASPDIPSLSNPQQPQVTYVGAAENLAELIIPQLRLAIPDQLFAEASSANSASSITPNVEEGERLFTQQTNLADGDNENVSPRIQALFDEAVAELGIDDVLPKPAAPAQPQALKDLNELTPEQRRSLPRFEYNSHMYSGRTQERWIRLNDRMLREGDRLGDLRVVQIQAAHTIFGFREILFRVEALEDLTD